MKNLLLSMLITILSAVSHGQDNQAQFDSLLTRSLATHNFNLMDAHFSDTLVMETYGADFNTVHNIGKQDAIRLLGFMLYSVNGIAHVYLDTNQDGTSEYLIIIVSDNREPMNIWLCVDASGVVTQMAIK